MLASKLVLPNTNSPPKLYILHERRPAVTLQDVLEDTASLREDRATVCSQVIDRLFSSWVTLDFLGLSHTNSLRIERPPHS